jgi:hypothetical protein
MRQIAASGQVIDDLVLIAEAATAEEWKETIVFLPLKTKRDRTGLNDQTRKEGKSRARVSGLGNHRDREPEKLLCS